MIFRIGYLHNIQIFTLTETRNKINGELHNKNILVTGGAGFIGTAVIHALLSKGHRVTVVDRFSSGKKANLESFSSLKNLKFIRLDLLDDRKLTGVVRESDIVFHLAGNVDVRKGYLNTEADFLNNIVATRNILESMRICDRCKKIIFTSSSVVYGEASIVPTPENYGPLKPISIYGASKLACEALISGYAGSFGIDAVIFRLANVLGPTIGHGVVFDFFRKLKETNGKYLEILGDGNQKKSYLYIDDCINALAIGLNQFSSGLEIFNVGSDDQVDTNTIARIIITELGYQPQITHSSQLEDGRGWIGDVKNMLLSTDKLKNTGWKTDRSSEEAISLTVKKIVENDQYKAN